MKSLFFESDMEEARSALLAGQEQESIIHIYTLLQKELQADKLNIGLYPTPLSLARFMVEVAQPEPGQTIYDPACGLGSFFVEAHRYLRRKPGQDVNNVFVDYDINPHLLRCGKAWMEANSVETSHIRERDMLKRKDSNGSEDDSSSFMGNYLILTHPPYERSVDQTEKSSSTRLNGTTRYCYAEYVDHCMELLQKYSGGRCGIIVPQHFFYNSSKRGRKQMLNLVNEFNLRLLVRLPKSMFSCPGNEINYYSYLLYFDKQGTTSKILCSNISEDETSAPFRFRQTSNSVSFTQAALQWELWRQWPLEKPFPTTQEERGYVKVIDAAVIRERDLEYKLIDNISPQSEEEPAPDMDELIERFVEQTGALYELAQQLQKRIKDGV